MSRSTSLRERTRRVALEAARFMTVGGLATLVSFVGFNALVHGLALGRAPLRDQPLVAYVLVNLVAGVVAYLGLRLWAFRERTAGDTATGLVKFFALGAVTMAVPTLCLYVSRYVLGLSSPLADNISANAIGLGLSTVARFWVFRRYVFDGPTPSQA